MTRLFPARDDRFMSVEDDHHGRIMVTWTNAVPSESGTPTTMSLTAFRSNTDPKRYFIGLADYPADDFEGKRYESTGYVDAKTAAMLSEAFAHIAVALS